MRKKKCEKQSREHQGVRRTRRRSRRKRSRRRRKKRRRSRREQKVFQALELTLLCSAARKRRTEGEGRYAPREATACGEPVQEPWETA